MKQLVGIMMAMLVWSSGALAAQQVVNANNAYIPSGFDSSSDAFVIVSGIFPSGCYQWKEAQVTHVSSSLHEVRAVANVFEGLCIMVMVPFQKEVQLGKLAVGEHTIKFMNGDGTFFDRKLTIEQ